MPANHYPSNAVKVTIQPITGGTEVELLLEKIDPKVMAQLEENTKLGKNANYDVTHLDWTSDLEFALHRSQDPVALGLTAGSLIKIRFYPDRTNAAFFDEYPVVIGEFQRGSQTKQNVKCKITTKARGDDGNPVIGTSA